MNISILTFHHCQPVPQVSHSHQDKLTERVQVSLYIEGSTRSSILFRCEEALFILNYIPVISPLPYDSRIWLLLINAAFLNINLFFN